MHALSATVIAQGLRDPLLLNLATTWLGDIELCAGNLSEAQRHHRQAIRTWQELHQVAFLAHELESFAYMAREQKQSLRAARLLSAAEAVQERIGTSALGVMRLEGEYQKTVAWLHTQFDETTYAAHWSEGCDMSMEQAIAYALED